jgi:hypothetical protein
MRGTISEPSIGLSLSWQIYGRLKERYINNSPFPKLLADKRISYVHTQSRMKIVRKLSERTRGAIGEEAIGELLDAGKMKQFCVELIRAPDPKMSVEFAQAILHQES